MAHISGTVTLARLDQTEFFRKRLFIFDRLIAEFREGRYQTVK